MSTKDPLDGADEWLKKKLEEVKEFDDTLAQKYKEMTNEQLYDRFKDMEEDVLRSIVDEVALDREAYEACAVVKKILAERGLKL